MEEQANKKTNLKVFAIVGMIVGSFSLIFSLIPCVGSYAMIPALLALIFSALSYGLSKKENLPNGLALAALIISSIALAISIYQYYTYQEVFETKRKIDEGIQTFGKELNEKVLEEALEDFKGMGDSIIILDPSDSLDADSSKY